ncbi:MAG: DUF378 domain-containing protein [Candidatus Paceibacterota bacterium]
MKKLHMVTFILLIIGGLNWLLVGLMGYDISIFLGGMDSMLARVIYVLVGASAVVEIINHKRLCRGCCKGCGNCEGCKDGVCEAK